jgi:hypothetical protein
MNLYYISLLFVIYSGSFNDANFNLTNLFMVFQIKSCILIQFEHLDFNHENPLPLNFYGQDEYMKVSMVASVRFWQTPACQSGRVINWSSVENQYFEHRPIWVCYSIQPSIYPD